MPKAPESPLASATELYPPKSGRFMLVYDLDDLGVDYDMVQLYYRMALSMTFDASYVRNRMGGVKPWTVAPNGDVKVAPAGNYLMRMVCTVVQMMLEHAACNKGEPGTIHCTKYTTGALESFGDYELLVGLIADMATSMYRLLPDHVTWISLITVEKHLAYVYAGQTPVEDACLTMSR